MRAAVKAIVEALLGSDVATRLARRRLRGARLVLAYHDLVSGGDPVREGDTSLHLPLDSFRSQLDAIAHADLRVVQVSDPPAATSDEPEIAITFDDAYAGAVRFGVTELAARGLPATIFVAPGLLGAASPWWDRVADPTVGAVGEKRRDELLSRLAGEGDAILARAEAAGWPLRAPDPRFRIATEEELDAALQGHSQLRYGAHSWSHPNLAALSAARLEPELRRPLEWLRRRWSDRVIPWLAYPYGLDSAPVRDAAEAAGYAGAVRVTGSWHRTGAARFAIPRLNVTPGITARGFKARLAGLR